MKKMLSMALLLLTVMAHAQDVYVYQNNIYTPVLEAKGFRCVAFNAQGVEVRTTDGNSQTVPYEQCDYIRFTPTPVPTGITSTADAAPSQQTFYSITGQLVGSQLQSLPSGVYLLREKHNGQESVKKVLKK